ELADEELGRLVALDDIYEVQSSALSNDTQNTMARVLDYTATQGDELAARVAKAVALLQLIQDDEPTSAELVARCLYDRVDRGDFTKDIEAALERLREENYVTYSEKHGYKLQSSAGQEWMKERQDIGVSYDDASELVREQLKFLVDNTYKPALQGASFDWEVFFSDGRNARDEYIKNPNTRAVATVDFRLASTEERSSTNWIQKSDGPLDDRFVWVVGRSDNLIQTARKWGRSRMMVQRYEPTRESLEPERLRLLSEEQARKSRLKKELRDAVEDAWMRGAMYFKGQELDPREYAGNFSDSLHNVVDSRLSKLYPYFDREQVTSNELEQLFQKSLAGVSQKFLEENIGILSMDAGSHSVTCEGEIPRRILEYIEKSGGAGGSALLEHF
ncbi:MAG: BREX system P-loop protein BrxC, partial [Bradymonadaceae bacterium]